MMPKKFIPSIFVLFLCLLFTQCDKEEVTIADDQAEALVTDALHPGSLKKPEGAGNCLSYPVIWAEGVPKVLRGDPGMTPELGGAWWYTWGTNGTDPNITPASCPPDPDASDPILNPDGLMLCDDGVPGSVDLGLEAGTPPADVPMPLAKAYLQKELLNVWQANSADWSGSPVNVHWIDWGDNLESVDWYTRSQVRTEVVLFQDLDASVTEYEMRHTSGWGIDEVHGLAATLADEPIPGPGTRATIFSPCARFMIQKLNVDRDDARLSDLTWVPEEGWIEPTQDPPYPDNLINEPIFNEAVYNAQDGPGYYNAEVNVKGRIIYGYTWNVRKSNEGAGFYRLTFSFDETCGSDFLNTFFVDEVTNILLPLEEEVLTQIAIAESDDSGDTGGGTAVLKTDLNLTYMDINILERGGGGGGGGKPSGGGGGGGHGGGRN